MTYAPVVAAGGALIPPLGLGTWQCSGEAATQSVLWALDAGYRHIDTAARYGNEEAIGLAFLDADVDREDLFVTTKVWCTDLAAPSLLSSTERSLRLLGLDYVDLLLVHWPNQSVPLAETIRALCSARRSGLTRHIGVANFPAGLLERAIELSSEPIAANQCEYHPRLNQSRLLDTCRSRGVAFVSYSPLGSGSLLREPAVCDIAARLGRSPAQVILRWHIQQPGVVAIPRSSDRQRIISNIAVFDFALSSEDMSEISSLSREDGRLFNPSWAPDWDDRSTSKTFSG